MIDDTGSHNLGTDTWYEAATEPEVVEFGTVRGLSVAGQGQPGGTEYGTAVQALYGVAGALLGIAGPAGQGFPMPLLEGRWWVEDEGSPFEVPREEWHWHLFLRLPDGAEASWVDQAREMARPQSPAVSRAQLVTFTEGRCVQVLHEGPYSEEPRSLARMEALMDAEGLVPNGLHHEVYLSDVRETDPEKLRTILRQPVRSAA
ncbi:GyrI-like domain-containing protein [Actinomadura sp. 9N407]|uniref:GyrI-like domain-containing protein n=1 Tax=Actinomadura sp. 9N407 TaxID=3375154 RepID=UPI00378C9293